MQRCDVQAAMAIMAEVEEKLLRLSDFEDIIRCLKSDPAQWTDDKLRGILAAAYLSSVSEAELRLARQAVVLEIDRATLGNVTTVLHNSPSDEAQAGVFDARQGAQSGAGPSTTGACDGIEARSKNTVVGAGDTGDVVVSGSDEQIAELLQSELQQLQWAEVSDASEEKAAQATSLQEAALADMLRLSPSQSDSSHVRRLSHTPDVSGPG
jgi:hypothetical protein